jgi:hypothetical protein
VFRLKGKQTIEISASSPHSFAPILVRAFEGILVNQRDDCCPGRDSYGALVGRDVKGITAPTKRTNFCRGLQSRGGQIAARETAPRIDKNVGFWPILLQKFLAGFFGQ